MRVLLRNLFWMGKECLSHTESEIEYALTEREFIDHAQIFIK